MGTARPARRTGRAPIGRGADRAADRGADRAADREADRELVLTRTRLARPAVVPELQLHLADDMEHVWAGLQAELDDATLPPPFWAFAWLGGQAVARHVLDVPEQVAGRRVLDLAAGSGLCGLAALLAGAAEVTSVDVDPVAVTAARLNAEVNGLPLLVQRVDVLAQPPPAVDIVLAGDVFYDAAMAARVEPWLLAAHQAGVRVLVGDPGRHYLPRPALREVAAYDIPTTRELEGVLVRTTRVYAVGP
ncbi:MAG: SAM-dependent methyltransferases [uncultured Frankineae bacterium]|uniref:SAM-dependent methyltransferases n=1 Tax=uncultured Frankineae bacterium TaxID=437475 RepID=A0A6J4M9H5_9ACTN|nr:MAG: SAM-dependent methyltransferases [uncultured Frankineae bacterium]